MKYTKICPYCKTKFTTDKSAKKFCRRRCAVHTKRQNHKNKVRQICQWCGQIFTHERAKKFCCGECRRDYMTRYGLRHRVTYKIPVKVTLSEAARKSKEEGVSYGTYVTVHKLY